MNWRVAKSLLQLRRQVDKMAPNRSKQSDGTIGDTSHKSRRSDHNAWVDGNVVTALDITHDPRHGMDCNVLADQLVYSGDDRIKYIIWNRRIWNPRISPSWRSYRGSNPHTKHLHVSVHSDEALYDEEAQWIVSDQGKQDVPNVKVYPIVKLWSQDADSVALVKKKLIEQLQAETGFGPLAQEMVKAFQRTRKLGVDGVVGAYTWEELLK